MFFFFSATFNTCDVELGAILSSQTKHLISIECAWLGLMDESGCARMQSGAAGTACTCVRMYWRGSSMEGAAMELKVSLSIHK